MRILTKSLLSLLATAAVAHAQSPLYSGVVPPSTTFAGNTVISNTTRTPATHFFDVNVTDPNGILVTQFDDRLSTAFTLPGTFSVYVTAVGGTANGFHMDPSVWTLMTTQTVTQQSGIISIVLPTPVYLAPGIYGMALFYDGPWPSYSSGASTAYTLPLTYVANEVTLDCTNARIRRSSATDPFDPTTGNGWSPRHPNIAMHFTTNLQTVDFIGTPLRGASPLQVQFTDYSFSALPGGILAWAWDFGDGTTSTLQSPQHTYTLCGDHTVSLTIFDTMGGYTETKVDYVQTDLVTADFSAQMIAPNMVQFTDMSTPTPTSWDWDLDGDGFTDSTVQNPLFTYTTPCASYDVTLTVSLACRAPVTLTRPIAVAEQLHTIYQGGLVTTSTATGGTNFIDASVTHPSGISICGMNVRDNVGSSMPLGVEIWQKDGTYVGAERTPDVWRLVASETLTGAATGGITYVSFTTPIYLASGTHGLAIRQVGASPVYTNLGGTQVYTNPDLTITAGATMADPLFDPLSTLFNPRIWNGAIFYQTSPMTGAPGYGYIGEGCVGTLGVPGNTAASQPQIGTTMNLEFDKVQNNAAIFMLGFSRTNSIFGPLPVDMTPFGAPGCMGRVSPDATAFLVGSGNLVAYPFVIPPTSQIVGFRFYTQAFSLEIGLNQLGGVMSDAAACIIGM